VVRQLSLECSAFVWVLTTATKTRAANQKRARKGGGGEPAIAASPYSKGDTERVVAMCVLRQLLQESYEWSSYSITAYLHLAPDGRSVLHSSAHRGVGSSAVSSPMCVMLEKDYGGKVRGQRQRAKLPTVKVQGLRRQPLKQQQQQQQQQQQMAVMETTQDVVFLSQPSPPPPSCAAAAVVSFDVGADSLFDDSSDDDEEEEEESTTGEQDALDVDADDDDIDNIGDTDDSGDSDFQ
jgi:hypothetical protein